MIERVFEQGDVDDICNCRRYYGDKKITTALLNATFKDKFVREEKAPAFRIFWFVDDVKINIIHHPHPLSRRQLIIDNIRMLSTEDIIAMKVQAILGRGKKKDF